MDKFTGIEYIKIAVANAYGKDKELWKERIAWFDLYTPSELELLITYADEPLLMQKGLNAYSDALQGIPTGYIMGLDATTSGIQVMGALIGCIETMENTNLVNQKVRRDLYTKIVDIMNQSIEPPVTRAMVKDPVMHHYYGGMKTAKRVFKKDVPTLEAFYNALSTGLTGAEEVMVDIQSCWQPNALVHQWTLPDGHVARVKVLNKVDKKIEIDELDHATFTHRAIINEAMDLGLSLCANVTHSFDGYIVREMTRRAIAQGFEILHIHDSFWASPNHMNEVRQNYVNILAELHESNALEPILAEITNEPYSKYQQYSNKLGDVIRESNYALS
jgi:DNA-directed RNA polymerase